MGEEDEADSKFNVIYLHYSQGEMFLTCVSVGLCPPSVKIRN